MASMPQAVRTAARFIRFSTRRQHSTSSQSTVNPTEVSHFNALASSWWDPHGSSRLLHLMNPLRHEFIDQCRTTHTPTSSTASNRKLKYLDVGCGGGIFAESAARLPHVESVTGIDPSPLVLAVAKTHAQKDPTLYDNEKKLRYLNTSIEQLELPKSEEEGYDVLALWEVIEHVDYPTPFLEECIKHVRPGGWLVLSTIARTWTSWAVTKVVAEDIMRVVPRGTHDWSKYIQEKELRDWFARREGWGPTIAKGCVYVPGLGWRWVDGGEKWGNYFFAVRKPERIIHYEAV